LVNSSNALIGFAEEEIGVNRLPDVRFTHHMLSVST
jgi:hypothetical protein